MKLRESFGLWMWAPLAVSACGAPAHLVPVSAAEERTAAAAVSGDDAGLPESLSCVSSAVGTDDLGFPQVLRVTLTKTEQGFDASVQPGPQFFTHDTELPAASPAEPQLRSLVVNREKDHALLRDGGGLTVTLAKQGGVFLGSFVDEQCYVHTEASLTCFNQGDLFGSPWTGQPGALAAHFDWATGDCSDADGAPAMNHIPVEIVRETGFGECADLSDTKLNGDDLNMPDLSGWYLAGANLDGAQLFFANLQSASLQGANLAGFEFGYADVDGSIDDHTVLPSADEGCTVQESPWSGQSVTCAR